MFGRGSLKSYTPIPGGIDNSNYFVELEQYGETTEFVLTIMESHSFDEAPFFGKVLGHLHHYGLPVPAPQPTLDGMTSTIFCGKPSFLVRKLQGSHCETAAPEQCHAIGEFLAAQHKALSESGTTRENSYPVNWMRKSIDECRPKMSEEEATLLNGAAEIYESLIDRDLPAGLIHGDLFRDNALFEDGQLTGVIDYYRACDDLLALDLTIAINDWCRDESEQQDNAKRDAMIEGYESVRNLTRVEKSSLTDLQYISAARFALTRYLGGELKDPSEMLQLARRFRS